MNHTTTSTKHPHATAPAPSGRPRRRVREVAAASVALALALALAGCGDDPADQVERVQTASDGSEFNQADVEFLTQMIPHHAQAVEMVVMAQGRDLSAPVVSLMEDIRTAQVPEVEMMADWLTAWDQPVPETSLDHANAEHGGMDDMSGMAGMEGMMSNAEMDALDAASDADFEPLWLSMMLEHHAGAITMARAELDDGHNSDAIALADDIVAAQTEEIALMETLR